jgi:hypothetical protein
LLKLGPGRHFGEWWGQSIQRGYGMKEKVFSLFNTSVWNDPAVRPACGRVVPTLGTVAGYENGLIEQALQDLRKTGSLAAPGFMNPEGIVLFHAQSRHGYKITLDGDGHKGTVL